MLETITKPFKAKHYLWVALGVFLLAWALIFAGILNKYSKDEVKQEDVLRLSILVLGYPDSVSEMFNNYMDDDVLTKSEHGEILTVMKAYDDQFAKQTEEKKPMTELEKAEANLAAYDRVGYAVFPENQRDKIRVVLVDNINKLNK